MCVYKLWDKWMSYDNNWMYVNNNSHGKLWRELHTITNNAIQLQHTLCILYAYQYCRRSLIEMSNDPHVCTLQLWQSTALTQTVAAHMQLDVLLLILCRYWPLWNHATGQLPLRLWWNSNKNHPCLIAEDIYNIGFPLQFIVFFDKIFYYQCFKESFLHL